MQKIIITLAMMLAALSASAQVRFTDSDTDQLRTLASSAQKLVFIDLYAPWCPPCRKMDSSVFSRRDVGDFMNDNFVCAKYNVDQSPGKELAMTYEAKSIPTYLVFNVEGDLVGRMMGGMSHKDFLDNMREMLTKIEAQK